MFKRLRQLAIGAVAMFLLCAGSAHATTLKWSDPITVTSSGQISSVVCESATICTVLAGSPGGTETAFSFNPVTSAKQTDVTVGDTTGALTCPTAELCVVPTTTAGSDGDNSLLSFNPSNPSVAVRTIAPLFQSPLTTLKSVGCADANECVEVASGNGENEITAFDPVTGSVIGAPYIYRGLDAPGPVQCPSEAQCTMALNSGNVATFDPQTMATSGLSADSTLGKDAQGLTCFSTTRCVEFTTAPTAVTFDPLDVAQEMTEPLPARILDPSCATATFCVAPQKGAGIVSGNPQAHAKWTATPLPGDAAPAHVACATATLCLATSHGNMFIGTPHGTVGLISGVATVPLVGTLTASGKRNAGLTVTLRCAGASNARCVFKLTLASAGVRGLAAATTVTLETGYPSYQAPPCQSSSGGAREAAHAGRHHDRLPDPYGHSPHRAGSRQCDDWQLIFSRSR